MKVVKPIFIVGTGRCGSTAFHRTLGTHPQTHVAVGLRRRVSVQARVESVGRHGDG